MGDEYTIADIATFPWVRNLIGFYGAGELVGFAEYPQVQRVLEAFVAKKAKGRGRIAPTPDEAAAVTLGSLGGVDARSGSDLARSCLGLRWSPNHPDR